MHYSVKWGGWFLVGIPAKVPALTVGSHSDEGGSGEEEDENDVTAEKEPPQRGQVVEPGGRVRVQGFMEERLEVGLASKRADRP